MKNKFKIIQVLVFIGVFLMLLALSPAAFANSSFLPQKGDGRLSIYNYHENDYLEVTYRTKKSYDYEALKQIERIFRSRGDGKQIKIDIRLIELLDTIQDHFGAETVELISGYRSPTYNKNLINEGRGAAFESLHKQGMAADIHIDEAKEESVFEYAKSLGTGGVGIYPRYMFVHVDVGDPRSWREAGTQQRILTGTENNPNPTWSAITDKNSYSRGEKLSVAIANNDYKNKKFTNNVWIEKFSKGAWTEHFKIETSGDRVSLEPSKSSNLFWDIPNDFPNAKYRLVIFAEKDKSSPPVYSNEFYVRGE